jgi:hypothetical protein
MMVSPRGRGGLALWHRHCRGRAPGRGGGFRQRQQQASGARHQACAPQGWHRGLADAAGGGGGGGWGQWARGQWARYEAANLARPLLVRGTTGIVLYGIGDVAAQLASAPAGEEAAAGGLDGERTARCCSWRALVFTPMCHSFYLLMEHAVVASGLRGSLLKLAIDFVCFGPIVTVSVAGAGGRLDVLASPAHRHLRLHAAAPSPALGQLLQHVVRDVAVHHPAGPGMTTRHRGWRNSSSKH